MHERDQDVLLVGQREVLVHVHADAPLAALLGRGQTAIAGLAAHAKDDVHALVDQRVALDLALVRRLKVADVDALDLDVRALLLRCSSPRRPRRPR